MIPARERRFVQRYDDLVVQTVDAQVLDVDALLDRDALLPEVWIATSDRLAKSKLVQNAVRWVHRMAHRFEETAQRGRP